MRLLKTVAVLLVSFNTILTIGQESDVLSPEEQLIIAADEGDTIQAAVLIRQGADINAETYEGVTSLMFAAQRGYFSIVRLLVNSGAELNSAAYDGNTALTMAIQNGYYEIAAFLLEKGANSNASDMDSTTALMQAIAIDSFYFPDLLIYYGADIHKKDRNGKNALMYAAEYGRFEIAFILLEGGADINSKDKRGNTPLHFASYNGQDEIIELLLINNALVDEKNYNGFTPLGMAVSENHYEAAKSLIAYGADVNARITRSQNLLSLSENSTDSIRRLLEVNGAENLHGIYFNRYSLGSGYIFNGEDNFLSLSFGLSDNRYHLMPGVSYGLRPKAIRVIRDGDEGIYYQYWERRQYLSFSLDKGFFLMNRESGMNTSAFLGLGGIFTFGSYRGADTKPKAAFVLAPRAGCMFDFNALRINVFYQLTNFKLKNYDKHWAGISLEFLIRSKQANRIIR